VAKLVEAHTPPSGAALDPKTTWVCTPEKFGRITTFLSRRYCVEPDPYMVAVRPSEQLNVFVLEPTEPAHPEPLRPETEGRRVPVDEWLRRKGYQVVPAAIAGPLPNKDPDDPRPWTLHRIMPRVTAPEPR
jgi:hypothetical protein